MECRKQKTAPHLPKTRTPPALAPNFFGKTEEPKKIWHVKQATILPNHNQFFILTTQSLHPPGFFSCLCSGYSPAHLQEKKATITERALHTAITGNLFYIMKIIIQSRKRFA